MKELLILIALGVGLVAVWYADAVAAEPRFDSQAMEDQLAIVERQVEIGCEGQHPSPSKEVISSGAIDLSEKSVTQITARIRNLQQEFDKDPVEIERLALETAMQEAKEEKGSYLDTIAFLESSNDNADKARLPMIREAMKLAAENAKGYGRQLAALDALSDDEKSSLRTKKNERVSESITELAELSAKFEKYSIQAKGCKLVAMGTGLTLEQAQKIENDRVASATQARQVAPATASETGNNKADQTQNDEGVVARNPAAGAQGASAN